MTPQWLAWARELQAIAQSGLHYARDPFDVERYEAVRRVAAAMVAAQSGADLAQVLGLFADQAGHATPKVDLRGAVFQDDAILLVRERSDGLWTLPGGWADPGEPPALGVEREIWEESGYRARAVKLLAVYDRDGHGHPPLAFSVYKLIFLCEPAGGEPTLSKETDAVAFFREHELPPLSLTRITPAQLARCFEHRRNPGMPTEFD